MPYQGILFKNAPLAANATSFVIHFNAVSIVMSIHSVITGSPLGTLIIEGSNDQVENSADVVNWVEITPYEESITAANQIMTKIDGPVYRWLRQRYIFSSGSGFITSSFYAIREK